MNTDPTHENTRHPLPQSGAVHIPSAAGGVSANRATAPTTTDDEFGPTIEGSREHPLFPQVVHAIQQVYDPEIPVNIYELGLIYRVDIDAENNVNIIMTLTSPACPSAQELPLQVRGGVSVIPDVKDVEVNVTFDPPWGPDKMSDIARVTLGMM